MTARELEKYLHEHIPLSSAMQVSVVEAVPERVVLGAPLAPNINHRETVFGGSSSALAILAAWSLLHTKLTAAGISTRLVIQRNSMSYDQAMAGYFTAVAVEPSPEAWARFTRMLHRKGRARIAISSSLWCQGHEAGRFEGEFVALAALTAPRNGASQPS
ncbi:MAG: thioesterase [Desulfobulbaceae bacterium A2]|nr:MAG: thioesterase [Desulfobulbaceae bacterium A2]